MSGKRTTSGTRERLLEAAERLILRDGVARMTLAAVSRGAGVSKGGLLYHFPTKDALIGAMIERFIERFEGDIEENLRDELGAGSWVRAYARATFAPSDRQQNLSVTAALVAAAANDPKLAEPLRERYEVWQRRVEDDGLEPALATLVRLAIDGAWLAELFGLAPPSGRLHAGVMQEFLRLSRKGDAGGATERRDHR
jgi:AcrR family transcriptional regulator